MLTSVNMLQKSLPNDSTGIKNDARVAVEMAHWLRTLVALVEEQGPVSSTHVVF